MPLTQKKPRRRRQIPSDALIVPLAIFAARTGISLNQLRRFADEGMPVLRLDRIIRVEVGPAMAWLRERSAAVQPGEET